MDLKKYGWDESFSEAFEQYRIKGFSAGRVIVEHRDSYVLYTEYGEMRASISGKFRFDITKKGDLPVVGDWVVINAIPEDNFAVIHNLLPRKSKFSRNVAGNTTEEQILASNIDTIFWVTSLNRDLNLRRIERYLVSVWDCGANPVIVLNKADLCDNPEEKMEEVKSIALGVPVYIVSAVNGYNFESLEKHLKEGKTIAFLGTSGVGKSTIINRLLGEETQKVVEIREIDGKGRHTTTQRQLIVLPQGGLVIDTPGIRELQLWETDGAVETFADIEEIAVNCKFGNCQHENEPNCAVKEAVENEIIPRKRFENYKKMKKESDYLLIKTSRRAKLEEKRNSKMIAKSKKDVFKFKNKL